MGEEAGVEFLEVRDFRFQQVEKMTTNQTSLANKFEQFCKNIRISEENETSISIYYWNITKRLNKDFWNTESNTSHSLYVGSYGRDTDILVSDIDMIMSLPWKVFTQYDWYTHNWQSSLLNAVKESLKKTYPTSHIKGDWQVVQINFSDGITFEIVPWFEFDDGSFYYPDTNNWWSWKTTKPRAEKKEIKEKNDMRNWNLKNLCRMIRARKTHCNIPIGWLLVDTFAYNFLKDREYKDKSFYYYDRMVESFFEYLKELNEDQEYRLAPWSNQRANRKWKFNYKATQAYNAIQKAIEYEENEMPYSANNKRKEIFGSKFTW